MAIIRRRNPISSRVDVTASSGLGEGIAKIGKAVSVLQSQRKEALAKAEEKQRKLQEDIDADILAGKWNREMSLYDAKAKDSATKAMDFSGFEANRNEFADTLQESFLKDASPELRGKFINNIRISREQGQRKAVGTEVQGQLMADKAKLDSDASVMFEGMTPENVEGYMRIAQNRIQTYQNLGVKDSESTVINAAKSHVENLAQNPGTAHIAQGIIDTGIIDYSVDEKQNLTAIIADGIDVMETEAKANSVIAMAQEADSISKMAKAGKSRESAELEISKMNLPEPQRKIMDDLVDAMWDKDIPARQTPEHKSMVRRNDAVYARELSSISKDIEALANFDDAADSRKESVDLFERLSILKASKQTPKGEVSKDYSIEEADVNIMLLDVLKTRDYRGFWNPREAMKDRFIPMSIDVIGDSNNSRGEFASLLPQEKERFRLKFSEAMIARAVDGGDQFDHAGSPEEAMRIVEETKSSILNEIRQDDSFYSNAIKAGTPAPKQYPDDAVRKGLQGALDKGHSIEQFRDYMVDNMGVDPDVLDSQIDRVGITTVSGTTITSEDLLDERPKEQTPETVTVESQQAQDLRKAVGGRSIGELLGDTQIERDNIGTNPTVDVEFIKTQENGPSGKPILEGYVPSKNSGVTISSGLDLKEKDKEELEKIGLPDDIVNKLLPFTGKSGQDAEKIAKRLRITEKEANIIDRGVFDHFSLKARDEYESESGKNFNELTKEQRTVITSIIIQYGSLSRTPKFLSAISRGDWDAAISELRNFGDDFSSRRNKEADLLDGAS